MAVIDPLRRFVATPHRAVVAFGGREVVVESNERDLVDCLSGFVSTRGVDLLPGAVSRVKIVRDADVSEEGSAMTIVHAGPVITLLYGSTTVLWLDTVAGEVLGFVTGHVSGQTLCEILLTVLCGEAGDSDLSDKQVTTGATPRDNRAQSAL